MSRAARGDIDLGAMPPEEKEGLRKLVEQYRYEITEMENVIIETEKRSSQEQSRLVIPEANPNGIEAADNEKGLTLPVVISEEDLNGIVATVVELIYGPNDTPADWIHHYRCYFEAARDGTFGPYPSDVLESGRELAKKYRKQLEEAKAAMEFRSEG